MGKKIFIGIIIVIALLPSGCNLLPQPQVIPAPTLDVWAISTQAMETISVGMTLEAQLNPSATPEPKAAVPENTAIPTEPPPPTATEQVALVPTETLQPVVEMPTATPEPALADNAPMLTVTENTNCRAGPHPMYKVEGYITTDMRIPVRGINTGYSWWFVDNPTYPGYRCWVQRLTSVVEGDTSTLPVYYDPWTPTPGTPVVSVDITAYTENLATQCPTTINFAGVIRTNRGGEYRYEWVKKDGTVVDKGYVTIYADSLVYLGTSLNIHSDASGTMQLRVVSPVKVYSNKVHYNVNCVK